MSAPRVFKAQHRTASSATGCSSSECGKVAEVGMKEERRSRRTPDHKKKSSMDVGIVCVEEEEKQEATQAGSSHRQPQGSERRSGPTGRKCVLYY